MTEDTDTADRTPVPAEIAGLIKVDCGRTVAITVGGKVFLVTAGPAETAPPAEPAPQQPEEPSAGDRLKALLEAQRSKLPPFVRYGPGGVTTLRYDESPDPPRLLDLERVSTLVQSAEAGEPHITVVHTHGASVHLPPCDADEDQLKALLDEGP